jgi:hypothetical protein
MRKILFSFFSVQGDPSRNEERAGKRGGGRKEKRRTRLKRTGRKDRQEKNIKG